MGQCYSTEEKDYEKRSYHAAKANQPRNVTINNEIPFSSINGQGNTNF